ncbi:MAG: DUF4468 domain-containing protein [Flavobacterium psychrophilum]|jgi:hypothetical protein
MKKNILMILALLLISCMNVYCQKIVMNEQTKLNEMNIEKSITKDKGDLFDKIFEWLPNYYTSPSSTVKFSDKNKGKIIYIGTWEKKEKRIFGTLFYTMTFNIEDNKYTCNITNFHSMYTINGGQVVTNSQKIYFEQKLVGKKKLFENTETNIYKAFEDLNSFIEK